MNSFEKLISPYTRKEFSTKYWLTAPCKFEPIPSLLTSLRSNESLFSLETLVESGHEVFKIMPEKGAFFQLGSRDDALKGWRSRESSATIVAESTELVIPDVWSLFFKLVNDISIPVHWSWTNIYYSQKQSGLIRHWDNHENFIIGLNGVKRFQIAPNNCVKYPEQNADNLNPHISGFEKEIEKERLAETLPGMIEIDVGPGEGVFIPRGWWHEAFALEQNTVTLTWAVWSYAWRNLFEAGQVTLTDHISELTLRTPLSLDHNEIPEEAAKILPNSNFANVIRAQAEFGSLYKLSSSYKKALERNSSE
jgi:ribosomal protein L16 Arg81 hydroxylase